MEESRIVLTDAPPVVSDLLSERERSWLRNQARKQSGQTSKYVRHQGAREKAKRLARMAKG